MGGIYIHIPLCHSKCAYCDFFSTSTRINQELFAKCIIKEYDLRKQEIDSVDTVYLGGGTPSFLNDSIIEKILDHIPLSSASEVTIEVNPEDVNRLRVKRWMDLGVNRVSMGVQSFVDSELKIIGRRHNSTIAKKAIESIREGGIDNFSIDLIYSLPTQSVSSWIHSIETLLSFAPKHFSAYMLTYEPGTRLNAMLKTGKIIPVDEDISVEMYKILVEIASKAGFEHYEISNFAIPGYRSKHNGSYWMNIPYLGLGPAAHSFDGSTRRINPSDINQYIRDIEAGHLPYTVEVENKTDEYNDLVITSLRTIEGLDFKKVKRSRRRQFLCDAFPHLLSGELVIKDNHFYIPEKHWIISDSILRDLIQ